MSELTQEAFEKALAKLATKDDLKGFATKEDIKGLATAKDLDRVAAVVAGLTTVVDEMGGKLAQIAETLDAHTRSLDALLKQTRDWNAEMTAMRNRMDRYEDALKLFGRKLKIDVTGLLQ